MSTVSNTGATNMLNRNELIALYKDEEFKASFIANYVDKNVHLHVAQKEFITAFNLIANDNGSQERPAIKQASASSIKSTFLMISSYGLSFDPNEKEVYVYGEHRDPNKVGLGVTLGYRGMRRIAMNSGKVKVITSEIVYESDSFTWLGADKAPSFASTGRNQDDNISCGFVTIRLMDNSVVSFKMSAAELLQIENDNIQMETEFTGDPNNSLYRTAWRERCLRAALWRSAYREYQHLFMDTGKIVDDQGTLESETETADAFEAMMAEALAENDNPQAVNA
ncbi:recombinase RecT [Alteromonas gilva]|uniref:Recombinase RecT n=1 Tax=Alteromonas gilva TaxID=2987522 RepID=A0ABT5LA25_9ALTE|nr:recombinase RecT [Alteromonas gilva]MDC8832973.1 recombinase RecT [Alteromonas gilva]